MMSFQVLLKVLAVCDDNRGSAAVFGLARHAAAQLDFLGKQCATRRPSLWTGKKLFAKLALSGGHW
ncbi:MAG: hypothetical protein LH632_03680 [Rhodoferax sp.]|nr:hypothetical protein [Rhodoferax sp.]